ncbi:MAG TPA: tetratricopeptide repeat protein [Candidatus Aminicenantes bacterium]|nr:tetratricopeptide repeat protein [Candidatus Aminicenantes bacterium]HRY63781.1 tetratricopeptide repeat protein [Candidatus Aminicenantes bacterium]HRZ70694.1 tetratricopeptide repeat protein [Candidatus Aminicenantes bacterium]
MISRKIAAVTALVLALAAIAGAQFQGKISGRVVDKAGNPVEKAEVAIVSQKTATLRYDLKTDKDGRFVQIGVMPGYFMLNVKRSGFAPGSKEIHIGIAGDEAVEITLTSVEAAVEKSLSAADKAFLSGNKLYAEQKYEPAAAAYSEAIALAPANWGYHLNLGLALKKGGKAEESLAAFRKAVELNPESYSANKETGEALAKSGAFAEAKPFYEKAIALSPDDPDAQYNLGVCLVNGSDSAAALPFFEKAVTLKPDYADAYYQIATIQIGQNRVPEARAALEKFLALAPAHEKAAIAKQLLEYLKK